MWANPLRKNFRGIVNNHLDVIQPVLMKIHQELTGARPVGFNAEKAAGGLTSRHLVQRLAITEADFNRDRRPLTEKCFPFKNLVFVIDAVEVPKISQRFFLCRRHAAFATNKTSDWV